MTKYNTLNVKLSTSKLNKLKLGIKNKSKVILLEILMMRITFYISYY